MGKLALVLMGGTMLSKSFIQFSVDEQSCVPSLLFDMRQNYSHGNEDSGDLFQKVLCTPCQPPLTHASPGDSWTLTGNLGQSLVQSLLLSPGFWCIKDFVCTLQESFSPVLDQTSIHTSDLFICTSVLFLFFSQFWFIFTLITLNLFSGRLPISLLFIWSCGFLQCSFICCMFLCLFLSFNLLCLESPFFRLEGLNSSLL